MARVTWFEVRGIGWPGERRAIRTREDADPAVLDLVNQWFAEADPTLRHAIHTKAAARALEPVGGLLPDGQVDPGHSTWEDLLTHHDQRGTGRDDGL